ncbi:ABC transporter permease [Shinella sedimenti]|uniref:ABC transporter permease n=1 Tax=Shinella sedimenti TaxID=2919913 RepID=A0ABT0CS09_9HYPH|nr:ABC transporter permease [Shinella sedimenti]MCJ8151399.1 ABC transporter permease [Shinella sedimenti]
MQKQKLLTDLRSAFAKWRIWLLLALLDIKTRYRRSRIGQFWITLSMGITIISLSFVYSRIFGLPLAKYVPLMAISFIVWGLLATLVTEAGNVFIEADSYIRSSSLPRFLFIFRMLCRNTLVFAHNLILVPVVMVAFLVPPTLQILWFFPAFVLTLLNGAWIAMLLGPLCARFRDLPQIIASIVQIAFFVSPVIWSKSQLGDNYPFILDLNPFAIFLELMREPLLGRAPTFEMWASAGAVTFIGLAIAIPFFARFRARVAYYM